MADITVVVQESKAGLCPDPSGAKPLDLTTLRNKRARWVVGRRPIFLAAAWLMACGARKPRTGLSPEGQMFIDLR
jgi:hypothetical protein